MATVLIVPFLRSARTRTGVRPGRDLAALLSGSHHSGRLLLPTAVWGTHHRYSCVRRWQRAPTRVARPLDADSSVSCAFPLYRQLCRVLMLIPSGIDLVEPHLPIGRQLRWLRSPGDRHSCRPGSNQGGIGRGEWLPARIIRRGGLGSSFRNSKGVKYVAEVRVSWIVRWKAGIGRWKLGVTRTGSREAGQLSRLLSMLTGTIQQRGKQYHERDANRYASNQCNHDPRPSLSGSIALELLLVLRSIRHGSR